RVVKRCVRKRFHLGRRKLLTRFGRLFVPSPAAGTATPRAKAASRSLLGQILARRFPFGRVELVIAVLVEAFDELRLLLDHPAAKAPSSTTPSESPGPKRRRTVETARAGSFGWRSFLERNNVGGARSGVIAGLGQQRTTRATGENQ